MSNCVENPKKRGRPSPPFDAKNCSGEVKEHDGEMWKSIQRQNGSYYWKKISSSNTPSRSASKSRKTPSKSTSKSRKTPSKSTSKSRKTPSKSTFTDNKEDKCIEQGKLFNPATGRCINDTPVNRKKLNLENLSTSKPKPGRNSSGKKVAAKSVNNTVESCKDANKLFNPTTKRCVKDTPSNRKLIALSVSKDKPTRKTSDKKVVAKISVVNTEESCSYDNKLFNPITKRCVKDTHANRIKLGIKKEIKYVCPENITSFSQCIFPEDVTHVYCDNNHIKSFQYLPGSVTHIYCSNNQIKSFQYLPRSVRWIFCGGNWINSFQYLPKSVIHINCENNHINSFQYLPDSVTHIYCEYNQINSFQYLPGSVREIDCGNNQINSFKYLPGSVTEINCDNNQINSFKYLPGSVTTIDCSNNQINSFQYLPESVREIWCRNNPCYAELRLKGLDQIHQENKDMI